MTSLASRETDAGVSPAPIPPAKAIATLVLAGFADWLFYDQRVGISAALFALVLACTSFCANRGTLDHKRLLIAVALVMLGLIPSLEDINALSLAFVMLTLGSALVLTTNRHLDGLAAGAAALFDLYLVGPFRFFADLIRAFNLPALTRGFALWFVPLLFGCIFVFLFAAANPLIAKWITQLNPGDPSSYLSLGRTLFWTAALALIWPFIQARWQQKAAIASKPAEVREALPTRPSELIDLFGAPTILRSLVLFNLLFAVQTILDMIYLWGNGALPSDITFASYAHRGAYPLIVTALLAAGFVLVAMRPAGPAEHARMIRPLVYLWVGQNILLVISSMLRLDLYVQTYLLTYWRIAAFVWMLLVAVGLALILARIALQRSNHWLVCANLLALTAVLYTCSLVNFAAFVADYNVAHSSEVAGKGVQLDIDYLMQLGPEALPAIDKAVKLGSVHPRLVLHRNWLVEQQRQQATSWRGWSFRSWRLQRYLAADQPGPAAG
ncbi:DUF4173 domain-containing protein [Bradyrhizobium jicamae]|nr:DUF4173 domain-containing protein [Bradyrhizobium jicamae]